MGEVTCYVCGKLIGYTDGMVPAIICPECEEDDKDEGVGI